MSAVAIRSSDVCNALRLRYPSGSHALLFEVADATGGMARRYADAVAVGLWPSHGHAIEGIEVKVSRSDFLHEMKQPHKSQAVFQYCNHWWLACPKDMVKPDEIPATWGLLELHGDILRTRVKAPKLTPIAPVIGFLAALLRRSAGVDEEMAATALQQGIIKARVQIEAEAQRRFDNERSHCESVNEEAIELLDRIKEETGLDLRQHRYRDDDMVAAINLAMKLKGGWSGPLTELLRASEKVIAAINESGLAAA